MRKKIIYIIINSLLYKLRQYLFFKYFLQQAELFSWTSQSIPTYIIVLCMS